MNSLTEDYSNEDPIYPQAEMLIKSTEYVCIASIQRQMLIGYNRASRLMDALIKNGVVEQFDSEFGGISYKLKDGAQEKSR